MLENYLCGATPTAPPRGLAARRADCRTGGAAAAAQSDGAHVYAYTDELFGERG